MTEIRTNGSKFLGQAPDSLDRLFEVLGKEPLHPSFEKNGILAQNVGDGKVHFMGNFWLISHCFDVVTDDHDLCERFFAALAKNMCTEAYRKAVAAYPPKCSKCGESPCWCIPALGWK